MVCDGSAREDYDEMLAFIHYSVVDKTTSYSVLENTADPMTITLEDMRAKELDIMHNQRTPETEKIMREKLQHVPQRVALASITESRGSQLGGAIADGGVESRSEE
jgi:hypothetical protein